MYVLQNYRLILSTKGSESENGLILPFLVSEVKPFIYWHFQFLGLLGSTLVLEVVTQYFSIYYPMEHLREELIVHLLSMMNEDVKLMERKGINKIETLQEVNEQPLAKLQQKVHFQFFLWAL